MIIIKGNKFFVPCSFGKTGTSYRLMLKSNNGKEYSYDLTDIAPTERFYYRFNKNLSELTKGEYEYWIADESFNIVASGTLSIGIDYNSQKRKDIEIMYDNSDYNTFETVEDGMIETITIEED